MSTYIVGFDNYVKIGFTEKSLLRRIAELQVGIPKVLILYGVLEGSRVLETRLHDFFKHYHTFGEWFHKDDTLNNWINAGCPMLSGLPPAKRKFYASHAAKLERRRIAVATVRAIEHSDRSDRAKTRAAVKTMLLQERTTIEYARLKLECKLK